MKTSLSLLALLFVSLTTPLWAGQSLTPLPDKPAAPDFSLSDPAGKVHTLSEYLGQPVVVNFWATWCPPCRREMPSMERAWKKLQPQGVMMLAVDVGEDEATVAEFVSNFPVSFPLPLDKESSVAQAWPLLGLPTTFVVNAEGRIVYKAVGGREWDDEELLKTILELRRQ